MLNFLAQTGIAGLSVCIVLGIVGFLMAARAWPAYAAGCRARGERPGAVWSGRYIASIEPAQKRDRAKRGLLLHGIGLAGAVLFFPFVLLAGLA